MKVRFWPGCQVRRGASWSQLACVSRAVRSHGGIHGVGTAGPLIRTEDLPDLGSLRAHVWGEQRIGPDVPDAPGRGGVGVAVQLELDGELHRHPRPGGS